MRELRAKIAGLKKIQPNIFQMHILSMLLALSLFYSVVFAANMLRVWFYLGYKRFLINIVVFSPWIDKLIWTFSIITFSSLTILLNWKAKPRANWFLILLYCAVSASAAYFLFSSFSPTGSLALLILSLAFSTVSLFLFDFSWVFPLFYGLLIFLAIELGAFACWIHHLFFPSLPFGDGSWHLAFLETCLVNIPYPVLPVLLMLFAYSWIGEFTFKGLFAKNEKGEGKKEGKNNSASVPYFNSRRLFLLICLFSVISALFIGYFNFTSASQYGEGWVGVDVPHYVRWLDGMTNSTSIIGAFSYAAGNDRFLYLILQYLCFSVFSGSSEVFVAYFMPVILTFLLMLASYFLVVTSKSRLHGATAMLMTAFSFQVTVGLFAGFYANWFALFFVFTFYGLLIRTLKMKRKKPLLPVLAGLFSVAVLYTHPWTWILLVMMILSAYMITTLLLIYFRKKDFRDYVWELKFIAALLAVNLVMFYIKGLVHVGSGATLVDGYINTKMLEPNIFNIFVLKNYLDRTFNLYVGGFYAYAPMILYAIPGVLSFLDYDDSYNRLLLNWMLVASAMAFVDFPWQARFLYMMPFNIYVALGVLYSAEHLFRFSESRGRKHEATLFFWVFYVLAVLFLLNYTVRCVVIKQFGSQGLTSAYQQ